MRVVGKPPIRYKIYTVEELRMLTGEVKREGFADNIERLAQEWEHLIKADVLPRSWLVQIENQNRKTDLFAYSGPNKKFICKLRCERMPVIVAKLAEIRRRNR